MPKTSKPIAALQGHRYAKLSSKLSRTEKDEVHPKRGILYPRLRRKTKSGNRLILPCVNHLHRDIWFDQ